MSTFSLLLDVSQEILLRICQEVGILSLQSLGRLACTCQYINSIASHPGVWRWLFEQYGFPSSWRTLKRINGTLREVAYQRLAALSLNDQNQRSIWNKYHYLRRYKWQVLFPWRDEFYSNICARENIIRGKCCVVGLGRTKYLKVAQHNVRVDRIGQHIAISHFHKEGFIYPDMILSKVGNIFINLDVRQINSGRHLRLFHSLQQCGEKKKKAF